MARAVASSIGALPLSSLAVTSTQASSCSRQNNNSAWQMLRSRLYHDDQSSIAGRHARCWQSTFHVSGSSLLLCCSRLQYKQLRACISSCRVPRSGRIAQQCCTCPAQSSLVQAELSPKSSLVQAELSRAAQAHQKHAQIGRPPQSETRQVRGLPHAPPPWVLPACQWKPTERLHQAW